jgi:tRNA threonylcarbamoyladenosine biosynthesis protein TsaE
MELVLKKIEDISQVAGEFINAVKDKKLFAFYGNMGVGKTTFIKEICRQLGVIEVVTSPTFALINEYHTKDNQLVYHFDLYRINKIEELFDFGYEDYLYSSHYCFIEWPEKAEDILPGHMLKVNMIEKNDGSRKIEF